MARNSDAVVTRRAPEVTDDGEERALRRIRAKIRDHVGVRIVTRKPTETVRIEIISAEHGLTRVELVQVADQQTHPFVVGIVAEMPVEAAVVGPLARLRELIAHEKQLLAGPSPHVCVE